MRTIHIALLAFLYLSINEVNAQSRPFPGLTQIDVDPVCNVSVFCDVNRCKIINKKNIQDSDFVDVLQTALVPSSREKYLIQYCQGPSDDPWFGIYRMQRDTLKCIGSVPGLYLYVPGTGFIYASGHNDNMFDMRRKFQVSRDTLVEIKQPFYYVGLDSKTLEDITIYSDTDQLSVVATLPKGSPVFVVANQGDYYLLKTPFGLLGWLQISNSAYGETKLKGIFYAGD